MFIFTFKFPPIVFPYIMHTTALKCIRIHGVPIFSLGKKVFSLMLLAVALTSEILDALAHSLSPMVFHGCFQIERLWTIGVRVLYHNGANKIVFVFCSAHCSSVNKYSYEKMGIMFFYVSNGE